jgi:hypothetical protein
MRSTATRSDTLEKLVAALQSGVCDQAAARELYTLGPDAVALALLAAARRIAEQDARLALLEARSGAADVSPSTPSGMIPVYAKPNATASRGRRRKRPGARQGHPGHRRPTPTRIDEQKEHRLKVCPCCGGPLPALPAQPHAAGRGPAREPAVGRHRAHDPPRLLPQMQEARRAGGTRRVA